ncbi:gamma-glutamylcyclotransferase family protein [Streptomyces sp. AK02-01A]|uniref:gamma-glutamylcyclotransferase family protein n=1 Tax=Streptomyces sp. AK02-01A TaxID=3028648 RepID=UPI0029B33CFA|nr:gamma-glutamylcyclotransferase family protein [Streptomyces sp. AK02-01A]MDX3849438.1 gamma-glutamylcyclotransferase [Streptomyces sp. AK02-01A]
MRPERGTAAALPFFVYGTLRPGERNHGLFPRGRTARQEPARLAGALLYDGPGYPYAVEAPGVIVGELVTAAPEVYGELLCVLDQLEEYEAPGDPRNVYERAVRDVLRADGTTARAWVYLAAPRVARELRTRGRPIAGGDWLARAVHAHRAVVSPSSPAPAVPRRP